MKKYLLLLATSFTITAYAQTPGAGVTDIDGNNYSSVIIGNQEWTAENLRTSRYANGDSITYEPSASAWNSLSTGAFTWYNNNQGYNGTYGKMYNWLACVDTRNTCPTGWHIPSSSEWQELIDTLGGASLAGGAMKDTVAGYWNGANVGATNSSGFSGLPGGGLNASTSNYVDLGVWGEWWSSTEAPSNSALGDRLLLNYNNSTALLADGPKEIGLSVRCLKDTSSSGLGIIDNSFKNDIVLYPNPTNGIFRINLGNNFSYLIVHISDLNGRIVQSNEYNNSQFLNLSIEEPAGIYFLTIESEGQRAVLRLVKY
jgi:uncharacterized protein (TIGR02145 family)